MQYEKLTPANLAGRVTTADPNDSFDVNQLSEEEKQKLCDVINNSIMSALQNQFGSE